MTALKTEAILDRARVREVTGVFYSLEKMERAFDDLLLAGFDRSAIDVNAPPREVRRRLGPVFTEIPAADLADIPTVPRQAFISQEDLTAMRSVFAATLGAIAALALTLILLLSGYDTSKTAIGAAIIGFVVAWIGWGLVPRLLGWDQQQGIVHIMWVRVDSDEKEHEAQEILIARDASAVHVHEIELPKTIDDIPLASLRPDPWLGNERLGQP